jgi:hypothetical protein
VCNFLHFASNHALNVPAWRNFRRSRLEHFHQRVFEFVNGDGGGEVDLDRLLVVGIQRTLSAATGERLSSNSLHSSSICLYFPGSAAHCSSNGFVHLFLNCAVAFFVSLDIDFLCSLFNFLYRLGFLHGAFIIVSGSSGALCALHWHAFPAVALVSVVACAFEAADRVCASGVSTAVVDAGGAFVRVFASLPVASSVSFKHAEEARSARAAVASNLVPAGGVFVAGVRPGHAFVLVDTLRSVAHVSRVAFALVPARRIDARRQLVAAPRIFIVTLVNVLTAMSVALESSVAAASVSSFMIGAFGVGVAFVSAVCAFVGVGTFRSRSRVSCFAFAFIPSMRIDALGKVMAVVFLCFAFVDIRTNSPIPAESFLASASKGPDLVHTFGISGTVMFAGGAFVRIDTFIAVLHKARFAFTIIAAIRVYAFRGGGTVVVSPHAFVNIKTVDAVPAESFVTLA